MATNEIILQKLDNLINEITNLKNLEKTMYTNKEMLEILDISSATLKKWRNNGYIGYSQVGSTYFYSAQDLEEFLKHNHNNAYAYL